MATIRLTESELIGIFKDLMNEGVISKWSDEVEFEYKMILSMIKTKYREIESLKNQAEMVKNQIPEITIGSNKENGEYVMTLKYLNPEILKIQTMKTSLGSHSWFDGPDDPELREWAESKAFDFLVQKFPKTYYY